MTWAPTASAGAAAAAALPASMKLVDRSGLPVVACGTRRYSAVSGELFAGKTTQPSTGWSAAYFPIARTWSGALLGQKAAGGAFGWLLHAATRSSDHRATPAPNPRNSADPQDVQAWHDRCLQSRAGGVAEQDR